MVCQGSSNECLLAAATALAIQIVRESTLEEAELLGAFFTVLGDQIILLSLGRTQQIPCNCKESSG